MVYLCGGQWLLGHLGGICTAVSLGSQCVLARFAHRHLTDICAAFSVES